MERGVAIELCDIMKSVKHRFSMRVFFSFIVRSLTEEHLESFLESLEVVQVLSPQFSKSGTRRVPVVYSSPMNEGYHKNPKQSIFEN